MKYISHNPHSPHDRPFASCGNFKNLTPEPEEKSLLLHKNELQRNWSLLDAVDSKSKAGEAKMNIRLPMVSFNHIAREVRNLEKSKRFYVDILGFRVIARPSFDAEGCWLNGYNLNLHLVTSTVPSARKIIKTDRVRHFSSALPRVDHTAFLSDDLTVIKDILDRHKVYYKYETLSFSGISQIFFFDPDGNVIEISNCAPPVGEVRCEDDAVEMREGGLSQDSGGEEVETGSGSATASAASVVPSGC